VPLSKKKQKKNSVKARIFTQELTWYGAMRFSVINLVNLLFLLILDLNQLKTEMAALTQQPTERQQISPRRRTSSSHTQFWTSSYPSTGLHLAAAPHQYYAYSELNFIHLANS
jgi:hypothetical protein